MLMKKTEVTAEQRLREYVAADVLLAAIEGNYDVWRDAYERLSITDLIWIHNGLHNFIGDQARFSFDQIESIIRYICSDRKYINVVELGCWECNLAQKLLRVFDSSCITRYTGYDIDYVAIDIAKRRVNDDRLNTIKCSGWLWEYSLIGDLFISCHTLEHFNKRQLDWIIGTVRNSGFDYMILEVPFLRPGETWYGKNNSHILSITIDKFVEIVEYNGFELLKNSVTSGLSGDHFYDTYLTFWRRK